MKSSGIQYRIVPFKVAMTWWFTLVTEFVDAQDNVKEDMRHQMPEKEFLSLQQAVNSAVSETRPPT